MRRDPTFPPLNPWDSRMLSKQVCSDLQPVETVHINPWFVVRNRGGYYTTEMNDAHGVVLPILENRAVVMVRVFRPLLGDAPLELPAGGFDPNRETPEQGLRRELAEETGIHIGDLDRFQPQPPLSVSPNRNPNLIFPFRVDLTQEEFDSRGAHDKEISEVTCFPLDQLVQMIYSGEIYVMMPVALISRWLMTEGGRGGSWDTPRM